MARELLPFDEALDAVLARARALPAERVALAEAADRVLAADAVAAVDLPPFATSAMDGFAVRAADLPGRLRLAASRSAAGAPAASGIGRGEAIAIATGGVVPAGADAVLPVELVAHADNEIETASALREGEHVRPRGGDVRAGDVVVPAGVRLTPARLGALAAAGAAAVECHRVPRAVVLATGSELRAPGERLGEGEIYEANAPMLAAGLRRAGASVQTLPAVRDDEDEHRSAIAAGLDADLLVTSGGVSVGEHDLVRRVAASLGVEELFWGVAVKPGKPLAFGVRDRTLVFGLPGNPVSSVVALVVFVLPAVRALQGEREPRPQFLPGELTRPVRRNRARDQFLRARARSEDGKVALEPLTGQESHMIARSAAADALVLVPRGDGELEAGASASYLPLV